MPDMGYYPFGSHFFTNLLHYTRSGDFVEAMIHDAHDVNEYAFALGALAHYARIRLAIRSAPIASCRSSIRSCGPNTATVSPTSRSKAHIMVEFAFDVVQVANGAYLPQAYHDFIGFEVATDLVDRAFKEIYGMDMKNVFASEDLAVGTFRYAVGTTIPQMTQVAWEKKRDEIEQLSPHVQRTAFVYTLHAAEVREGVRPQVSAPGDVRAVLRLGRSRACRRSDRSRRWLQDALPRPNGSSRDSFKASERTGRRSRPSAAIASTCATPTSTPENRHGAANTSWPMRRTPSCCHASLDRRTRRARGRARGHHALLRNVDPSAARDKRERKDLQKIQKQLAQLNTAATQTPTH
jgi:hypothetical protein